MLCLNLSPKSTEIYSYKIADLDCHSNLKINELGYVLQAQKHVLPLKNTPHEHLKSTQTIFKSLSLIGEKEYQLTVESTSDSSYNLQCDREHYIICKNSINASIADVDITVLLGPVLILSLAINKIFCLHASAFIVNNKIFILMAGSGTGKSTVARFINKQANCRRIADDILPLQFSNNKLSIVPSFPQLKLAQDEQYIGGSLELDTVMLFAEKSNETTQVQSINTFTSIKKLIKHSVATKLFAENELKNHLNFCHNTGKWVTSYQVKYQHSENSLQKLFSSINEIT